jgi:serine/threonine-protein kinase
MDLEKALKHIKTAWIAGLVSAGLTLAVTVLAMAGISLFGFTVLNLLDVLLMAGLSFGIYKKSRICAVALFAYFVASKVIMWVSMGNVAGLPLALVFGYFFYQGIRGTFAYQKLAKQPEPPIS